MPYALAHCCGSIEFGRISAAILFLTALTVLLAPGAAGWAWAGLTAMQIAKSSRMAPKVQPCLKGLDTMLDGVLVVISIFLLVSGLCTHEIGKFSAYVAV